MSKGSLNSAAGNQGCPQESAGFNRAEGPFCRVRQAWESLLLSAGVRAVLVWALMLFLVSGCASTPPPYQESEALRRLSLAAGSSTVSGSQYPIMPGDQLKIRFYVHSELNEDALVRPDGYISLQLIDDTRAVGLTPAELSRSLEQAYASRLKNPEITVMVTDVAPRKVYVGGEVQRPGLIETVDTLTALKAIVQSGGLKDTGNIESVIVLRYRGQESPEVLRLNLKRDLVSGTTHQDVVLKPYDIVFVPKTFIADANQFVSEYIDKMIPMQRTIGVYSLFVF